MRIAFGGGLTVTATDRWYAEIRAGRAFTGTGDVGAVVGEFSHIQLFNPAGSGRILLVHRFVVTALNVIAISMFTHNTELTTDNGAGANLLAGSTAGQGHVRQQTNVSVLGTEVRGWIIVANNPLDFVKEWDFELGEGEGIHVACTSTNQRIVTFTDWTEV